MIEQPLVAPELLNNRACNCSLCSQEQLQTVLF